MFYNQELTPILQFSTNLATPPWTASEMGVSIAQGTGEDNHRFGYEHASRISQMTLCFGDRAPGFWYKNHYVIGVFGVLIWLTRWVNRKKGF